MKVFSKPESSDLYRKYSTCLIICDRGLNFNFINKIEDEIQLKLKLAIHYAPYSSISKDIMTQYMETRHHKKKYHTPSRREQ